MIRMQFVSVIILIVIVNNSHQRKLPSFINRCKYSTDGIAIGKCITNAFNANRASFIAGIPEMHIPVLDPFVVDRVEFNTGSGSSVGINAVFTDLQVEGSRDVVVEKIEADIHEGSTTTAVLVLRFPYLRIRSRYVVGGRIMILPINGTGHADGNFTDIHSINNFDGKHITRKNKQYVEWYKHKINVTIGGASLYFDDLFNGNKELTESTNKVINENSAVIITELKPLVEETISSITFTILQQVFHMFSLEELFEH